MTSLAHEFTLVDPSRVMILPDGSTHVATVPDHFMLTGQLADSPTVSSSSDHAGARRVLYEAWMRVMSRPPTAPEIQAVQSIAL
ncbi:hypothetical protein, partial [Salmonella sp. SAL4433]|uniref:hypothetical protein n=1 Tax=Salmonella sp. SAL4433 TaxID=3159888 RepID=UPI00397A9401